MKSSGAWFLLLGLAVVQSALQGRLEETCESCSRLEPGCVNSTLRISLRTEGTEFSLVTTAGRRLLHVDQSVKDVFNLVDAVFNHLFPSDGGPSACEVTVVRRRYAGGGEALLADLRDGDRLLELGVKAGEVAAGEERACASVVAAQVDLAPGLDPNSRDGYNFTALHWAAFFDRLQLAERLVAGGADPNALGPMNVTPLKAAVATGDLRLVRLLVDKGADVNAASTNGMVPLIVAVNTGRLDVLGFLVERGADLRAAYSGSTALHVAAEVGRPEVVRRLVEAGMDADVQDRDGATPLHAAARYGRVEVVRYLLGRGAAVDARDALGRTPLVRATDHPLTDDALRTIGLLLDAGADLTARDRNGQSALSVLALANNDKVDKLLAARGYTHP